MSYYFRTMSYQQVPSENCYPRSFHNEHKKCSCSFSKPVHYSTDMCYSYGHPIPDHFRREVCCHGLPSYCYPRDEEFSCKFPAERYSCNEECFEPRVQPFRWWLPRCSNRAEQIDSKNSYVVHVCQCFNPSKILKCRKLI